MHLLQSSSSLIDFNPIEWMFGCVLDKKNWPGDILIPVNNPHYGYAKVAVVCSLCAKLFALLASKAPEMTHERN